MAVRFNAVAVFLSTLLIACSLSAPVVASAKGVEKSKAVRPVASRAQARAVVKSNRNVAAKKKVPLVKKAVARKAPEPRKPSTPIDPGKLVVQSASALVLDQGGGDAIFQKNATQVAPIASITKLMTAMVVLDSSPSLSAQITVTEEDVDFLRGSRSRLQVGSVISRESALLLALMSSENRAAHALARHYPGGMPAFLAAMNIKAQALGMRDTHFEDPTGLTSNNVSTATDLAKMVSAAYRYPLIREFTTTAEATVEVNGREVAYHNTNPLVRSGSWDVGLSKTGYIQEAGKCLVMQARVADKPVVIVLLDSAGSMTRVGDANRIKRWMEYTQASRHGPTQAASVSVKGGGPSA